MCPALLYNFNKYIKIMENHDIYNDQLINIDSCSFLTPTIVLPLVSFIYNYNKSIEDHKNPTVNEYLHKVLGIKKHTTTTFPFRWLDETTDNSEKLTKEIINIMESPEENINALKYIFHELIANVYDHSKFNQGFVIGQYYPKLDSTDYSFMDNGISIPGSFKKSGIPFKNDCDAIIQAVNGMSTRDNGEYIGRGTGLNSTINIVTQANGTVLIASGDCVLELTKRKVFFKKIPEEYIKGTLVSLRVPNKPLDVFKRLDYVEYKLPKRRIKPIKVKKDNV